MTDAAGNPCHFAFPFRRGTNGKVVVDVQDSPAHVMSQVNTVVHFPVGFRIDRPTFGITYPEFASAPIDPSPIAEQVRRQVPDADVNAAEIGDAANEAVRRIYLAIGS